MRKHGLSLAPSPCSPWTAIVYRSGWQFRTVARIWSPVRAYRLGQRRRYCAARAAFIDERMAARYGNG